MNAKLQKVKGKVEAVAQNAQNRYGVKVKDQWYNGFGSCPAKKGQEVDIQYTERNGFRNIKKLSALDLQEAVKVVDDQDRAIARCVALKCAVQVVPEGSYDEALSVASRFQKWLLQ